MKFVSSLIAAAAALALMPAAHAVSLQGGSFQTLAGNSVEDFSDAGALSFTLGLENLTPVSLTYVVGGADGAQLAFDALIDNFLRTPMQSVVFALGNGASFGTLGSAHAPFSTVSVARLGANTARVAFGGNGEGYGVEVGDVFGTSAGATDWLINLNGLQAGQSFTMTITTAVPEPSTYALVVTGLAVAGIAARRRRG